MKIFVKIVMTMGIFASMAAKADDASVKAEVIGSESRIGAKGDRGDAIRGYGAALSFESKLSDDFSVGARAGYVEHGDRKDGDSPRFDDCFVGLYSTFDFLNTGSMSLYASGGASFHIVDFNNQASEGIRSSAADAYLWNWDSGVGSRFKLSDGIALGLEYRYSDTFQRDDSTAKLSSQSRTIRSEFDNISLQGQQAVVSLSYAF